MAAPRFDDIQGEIIERPKLTAPGAPRFEDIQGQLQDAPKPRPAGPAPGIGETLLHQALAGYFKQGSDELAGQMSRVDPRTQMHGAAVKMPDGSVKFIENGGDAAAAGTEIERQKLSREFDAHPILSTIANAAGELGSDATLKALIPGLPVGSLPYQLANGALSGALAADDKTPGGRVGGAGLGLTAAGVGHGVGKYVVAPLVSKAAPVLLRALGQKLEQAGISQGRRALLNGADSLSRALTPDEYVREALRPGMNGEIPAILPFGTAKGAFKRLSAREETLGKLYGDIVDRLEANGVKGPEARSLATEMLDKASKDAANSGANKEVANKFFREAQNVENLAAMDPNSGGKLGLRQAENLKRALQAEAKYDRAGPQSRKALATKEVASMVRKANEDAVEAAGKAAPPNSEVADLAESFGPVKDRLHRTYGALAAAEKGAQKGANRSHGGLPGALAMASGDPHAIGMSVLTGGGFRNRLGSTAASGLFGAGALAKGISNALHGTISPETAALLLGRGGIGELVNLLRSGQPVLPASPQPGN